jgi:hypothetical protein
MPYVALFLPGIIDLGAMRLFKMFNHDKLL